MFSGGLATALLKILEKFLGRTKEKLEQESDLRTELRLELERKSDELSDLKDEVKVFEKEVMNWKTDYWALFESFFQLRLLSRMIAFNDEETLAKIAIITAPHELEQAESSE